MMCAAPEKYQARPHGRFCPGGPKPLMGMIEVTNRCNMACPICYADAKNSSPDVPLADIGQRLRRLLAITGTPIPIQISGGEPSLRDDLPQIVAMAKTMGYRIIELITNGIRIGEDAALLKNLKQRGLSAVDLQFDGLRSETTRKIRGLDMTDTHRKAVAAIRSAGLCCTLAVVVTRDVNEGEIGDIVNYGIENIDVVRAGDQLSDSGITTKAMKCRNSCSASNRKPACLQPRFSPSTWGTRQ